MNEIGYKSMSAASFNQDNMPKLFSDTFSRIPDATFSTSNNYTIADVETKEVVNLKRTVTRLEKNISFIQNEHNQMLKGLQNQVDKLREENQDLQFQLVMKSSRRDIISDNQVQMNTFSSNFHSPIVLNQNSNGDQIAHLKSALEKERILNNELIKKLESLVPFHEGERHSVPEKLDEIPPSQVKTSDDIDISPKIRISLEPLTLSLYHEGSGQYVKNTTPSRDDCEIIIRALLENPRRQSSSKEPSESWNQSISNKRSVAIPIIRKPLQIIRQHPRNSASIKLNPLHGSIGSKPVELLSSHPKLSPISPYKFDLPNYDEPYPFPDRECQHIDLPFAFDDKTVASSLPALVKSAEYNQAEKQRRLQSLQKKRLDQINRKR